jgi:hypothetical protein
MVQRPERIVTRRGQLFNQILLLGLQACSPRGLALFSPVD